MAVETGQLVRTTEAMDDTQLQAIVRAGIRDAIDYLETDISPQRAESLRYYRGDPIGGETEGRSTVVWRDVHDAVQSILPSLMDVFCGSERAVEYVPRGPEDVAAAEQATDYANYVIFQDNPGFRVLHATFKDALYQKVGIVKYWWDESSEVTYHQFTDLSDVALGALMQEEGVEITQAESRPDPATLAQALTAGMQPPMLHNVEVKRVRRRGRIRIREVPGEEFLISRNAVSIDTAPYVGHRCLMSVADLVALGYDREMVEDHASNTSFLDSEEVRARHREQVWGMDPANPQERRVLYTEGYMRLDLDADGLAELRKVCTMGESYEVVNVEPASERPFADFCPDPEPHRFFGSDIADLVKDLQRINSQVMRDALGSLSQSIFPRLGVVRNQVDMDDVLNPELGAPIRMNAPGMVQAITIPFVGAEAYGMLDRMERTVDKRVGSHNMALNADALQSTTSTAVSAQERAAMQHVALIARIFAETGMKRLLSGILKLITAHQDKPRMVRLRNTWVEINPATWDANMDVAVNVGLGNGRAEDRIAALGQTLTIQERILDKLGPNNPLVGLGHVRATLAKSLEAVGYKDVSQFFKAVPLDFEPPPAPPPPPSDAELLAQIEMAKVQQKAAHDAASLDIERDKLLADIVLRSTEIEAKYNTAVDVAQIRRSIEENRLAMSIPNAVR